MYEQTELEPQVRQWEADGKWIDRGSWKRARNGVYEYHPTPEEIEAKCELIRTIDNWQGAYARAPRGGKYAVMETKGLYTVGTILYWDDTANVVTTTSAGNKSIGKVVRAAASADTTVRMRLSQ